MDSFDEIPPPSEESPIYEENVFDQATLEQPQSYVYSPDAYLTSDITPPVPEADMYMMPEPEEEDALA